MINYTPIGVAFFREVTVVEVIFLAKLLKNNILHLESVFFLF
jgi:hypothetical protein